MKRLIALLMFIALPASANWTTTGDGSKVVTAIRPNGHVVAHYDFSDTTDPPVLSVGACESVNYFLNPDEDGTNTGITAQPYLCSENTFSANHCTAKYNDIDGDGVPDAFPLDGTTILRRGRQDVQASFLAFDITANPASDDGRITVECH